ncbi:hypothetical protein [Chitiniphilus shinanonensis]|uniref:hypothetical protein n=1 Tax=Chitiniphilus shinanonensis TaxID=553088 RepID=UPI00306FF18B
MTRDEQIARAVIEACEAAIKESRWQRTLSDPYSRGHYTGMADAEAIVLLLDPATIVASVAETEPSESFAEWLCREMPPNTIIGDPTWWAPRIERAVVLARSREAIRRALEENPLARAAMVDGNSVFFTMAGDNHGESDAEECPYCGGSGDAADCRPATSSDAPEMPEELRAVLTDCHNLLRQALADDDDEFRHGAILRVQVDLHRALTDQLAERDRQWQALLDAERARLDVVAAEYYTLEAFEMPTGAGDADVGWRVLQHHCGESEPRIVAEVYEDNPRTAIDAAMLAAQQEGA